jgi:hypothetical protein
LLATVATLQTTVKQLTTDLAAKSSENQALKQLLRTIEDNDFDLKLAKAKMAEQTERIEKYRLKIKELKTQLEGRQLETESQEISRDSDGWRCSVPSPANIADAEAPYHPAAPQSSKVPSGEEDCERVACKDVESEPSEAKCDAPELAYSNLEGFIKGCCYDTAMIHDDSSVQVAFKFAPLDTVSGILWLYLGNTSPDTLLDLSVELITPHGLLLSLEYEGKRETELQPKQKQDLKIAYSITEVFITPPVLLVSFVKAAVLVRLKLKLPVVITRFLQPCSLLNSLQFDVKWQSFSKERRASVVLRPSIESIDQLGWTMRLSNHFKVLTNSSSLDHCKVLSAAYNANSVVLVCLELPEGSLRVTGKPDKLVDATFNLLRELLEGK